MRRGRSRRRSWSVAARAPGTLPRAGTFVRSAATAQCRARDVGRLQGLIGHRASRHEAEHQAHPETAPDLDDHQLDVNALERRLTTMAEAHGRVSLGGYRRTPEPVVVLDV